MRADQDHIGGEMRVQQTCGREQGIFEAKLRQHQRHSESDSGQGSEETAFVSGQLKPGKRNPGVHEDTVLFEARYDNYVSIEASRSRNILPRDVVSDVMVTNYASRHVV